MKIQTTENTKERKIFHSNLFVEICVFCCEIKTSDLMDKTDAEMSR